MEHPMERPVRCWSEAVDTVWLEPRGAASILLALGRPDEEFAVPVQLVGRPGPGLADRNIVWERTTDAPAHGDLPLVPARRGVLVEASALDGSEGPSVRIRWHDEEGVENLLELTGFSCEVENGPPVVVDDARTLEHRARVVTGVREWLDRWRGAPDPEVPRRSLTEFLEEEEPSRPLAEVLGPHDYGPATHIPAADLEIITLGEIAKLERLQIETEPCPHMRIPHLYCWLTTNAIPRGTAPRRLPPEGASEGLLGGDDCPECAIEYARETEGVEL